MCAKSFNGDDTLAACSTSSYSRDESRKLKLAAGLIAGAAMLISAIGLILFRRSLQYQADSLEKKEPPFLQALRVTSLLNMHSP